MRRSASSSRSSQYRVDNSHAYKAWLTSASASALDGFQTKATHGMSPDGLGVLCWELVGGYQPWVPPRVATVLSDCVRSLFSKLKQPYHGGHSWSTSQLRQPAILYSERCL
jgi:hypothetical protein